MIGLYVHDGIRYIRVDQIEAISETWEEHKTDRYAAEPKTVREATRYVTTLSGKEYASPGTADEMWQLVQDSLGRYTQVMEGS